MATVARPKAMDERQYDYQVLAICQLQAAP
jgi:hypothetical protein